MRKNGSEPPRRRTRWVLPTSKTVVGGLKCKRSSSVLGVKKLVPSTGSRAVSIFAAPSRSSGSDPGLFAFSETSPKRASGAFCILARDSQKRKESYRYGDRAWPGPKTRSGRPHPRLGKIRIREPETETPEANPRKTCLRNPTRRPDCSGASGAKMPHRCRKNGRIHRGNFGASIWAEESTKLEACPIELLSEPPPGR